MPLPPWTPDLASLDLLISVARLGSIGRAATAHAISQPSASARLSGLERKVGTSLLNRSTAGTQLTPAGEVFVAWAQQVIDAAQKLSDTVQTLRADQRTHLRVAASLTIAEYLLPTWLLTMRRQHPGLQVSVDVANSADVCHAVLTGHRDLGFLESPAVPKQLSRRRIGTDRLAIIAAPSNRAPALSPDQLQRMPLLLREEGSGTRDTFLNALRRALGTTPALEQATSLGSTTTIIATARAGGGIGVVSARAVATDLKAGTLVELDPGTLDLHRPLHAVWNGRVMTEAAKSLVHIAGRPHD